MLFKEWLLRKAASSISDSFGSNSDNLDALSKAYLPTDTNSAPPLTDFRFSLPWKARFLISFMELGRIICSELSLPTKIFLVEELSPSATIL